MSSEVHTPLPITAPRPLSRRSGLLGSATAFAPALDTSQAAATAGSSKSVKPAPNERVTATSTAETPAADRLTTTRHNISSRAQHTLAVPAPPAGRVAGRPPAQPSPTLAAGHAADHLPATSPPTPAAGWSLEALFGRLAEISASGATAALTVACDLVLQAQLKGEPSAWITLLDSSFFPPDAACSGIDLDALPVVRVPDPRAAARAADKLVRSGAFGLVVIDLTTASAERRLRGFNHTNPQTHRADRAHQTFVSTVSTRSRPPVAEPSYPADDVSCSFPSPLPGVSAPAHSHPAAGVPMPLQSRLLGLARKHHTAVVFLTEKDEHAPSLGPLVSLRAEARRRRNGDSAFTCEIRVIKDKRHGPGRSHRQLYHGPAGLR